MLELNGYPVSAVVLEGYTSMLNDQTDSEKFKYREVAMEALLNPDGKSRMIHKLYADILSKSNIDYGRIPFSKGDLTSYDHYDKIIGSLEALNSLLEGKNIEELTLTNNLHNMIVMCRGDFEFGFKFDIELIKLTYNTMVMTLHEMINLCIVSYVNYLKEVKQIDYTFTSNKQSDRIVVKATRDFLKGYDNGEWTKLMTLFKKNSHNLVAELLAVVATVPGGAVIAPAVGIVLGVLALLFTIRLLIYVYYSSAMKIGQYAKIQSEFLKASIENSSDTTSTSVEKQKKMLGKLESLSSFIETKILKTEKDAAKELKESNTTNFTADELRKTTGTLGVELL